jgi:ATP-binding cassette subfamily B protein
VTLATQVNGNVAAVVRGVTWLDHTLRAAGHFRWLLERGETAAPGGHPAPVPARIRDGIEFRNVSFRYPGSKRMVLDGLDLRLPAGATVAIVGENGAGKTTLVKLLCGLYPPTVGRITVDGCDITIFGCDTWRVVISAAFQDFCKFELVVAEAVGIGDVSTLNDRDAARRALERVGAATLEDQLPRGLDTQLGTTWGGVDLSEGQWQKVALARATRRPRPLVVVLDEPTASLDAYSEASLFERFERLATETAGCGAITLLVSHRFSTVRMADLIVVLEAGRVAEQGTHDQLIAAQGIYAELYAIQAAAYRA